jgi:hypothetical protein
VSGAWFTAHSGEFEAAFLVAIGELSDPADAVNNAWDRGVVTFVDGGPVFSGNGIPDAMEFKLLETVLKDATLDLGFEGGVMNWHVYQDWRHNLAQARADFAGAPAEKGLRSPFCWARLPGRHPPG